VRGAVAAAAAVALVVPAVLVAVLPGAAAAMELDRSATVAGELLRLVTCHWAHWTPEHLLWDGVATLVLAFLCFERSVRRSAATLVAAAVAAPAAVLVLLPEMTHYRGLSGLASALFVLLALGLARDGIAQRRPWLTAAGTTALLVFAAKVAVEWFSGVAVFAGSGGFVPVPLAHVVGALVGASGALLPPLGRPVRSGSLRRWAVTD
jgi:rhomboid family GlyGly-CTERM serine protease